MSLQIQEEGRFKFVCVGEGEVLLFLHGLFGALSNFNDLIDHYSKTYKVVFPLLPIYDLPLREAKLLNLMTYIQDFVEHKNYKKVTVLGNSLGGHIALLYTLHNLSKVNALILTGSSGLFENAFGNTFPQRKNYEYMKQKTADTFFDPKMATKELVDEVYDIVNSRERALRVVSVAKSAIRHNMRENLPKLTVPTLLIWGKQDQVTPAFVADEFKALLPNAELHFIDKCGHVPMMEHPTTFIDLLTPFLRKHHPLITAES